MIKLNGFCGMIDRQKAFTPYFQQEPFSEILIIANLRNAASRIWTCAESDFRLCWMMSCSSDNHYACVGASFKTKLQASNFIKKETPTQVFSSDICEFFRKTYFVTSRNGCFWKFTYQKLLQILLDAVLLNFQEFID